MTLVGVGHALADAFALVDDDVPKALGLHPGSFNQVPDYRMRAILATLNRKALMAGGSAANVVKLAARLGVDAHFVGQCGHDEAAQTFESELLQAGVNVALTRVDSPTGLCVTFLSPGQGRTVATFRSASGGLRPGLLGETLLRAADVVVLEGYLLDEPEFIEDLLGQCARQGRAVALDVAEGSLSVERQEDLQRHAAAGAFRYLVLPESEAHALGPGSAETTVIVKEARAWTVSGTAASVPRDRSTTVDESGTDDAFLAGFLWAVGRGASSFEACRAGAVVASAVGEEPGTRVSDACWSRVLGSLSKRGLDWAQTGKPSSLSRI